MILRNDTVHETFYIGMLSIGLWGLLLNQGPMNLLDSAKLVSCV